MDDFYNYDEELEMVVGERTKKIYRLGDKLTVKLVRSDKDTREIDFELYDKKQKSGDKSGNIKQKGKL